MEQVAVFPSVALPMSPLFIKENIENKNLIIKYSMLCSLSTFNQNNSKVVYIPPVDPYSTALYRFSLNGNTSNTGSGSSQVFNTNSSTYGTVGGKSSNAILLTDATNRFYLTTRFNWIANANARGSLSMFVYPTTQPNNRYMNYLYYNSQYQGGVETTIWQIQLHKDPSAVKTFWFNIGSLKTTFTPQGNEFALNNWTHVAITWAVGTTNSSGTVNLYLNGNLRVSANVTNWNTFQTAKSVTNNNRRLASSYYTTESDGSVPNINHTFYMSNLAYWNNKQLNTTEISSIISNFT